MGQQQGEIEESGTALVHAFPKQLRKAFFAPALLRLLSQHHVSFGFYFILVFTQQAQLLRALKYHGEPIGWY
eukprot:scaffold266381_cov96-Cyclotella_meneghiniana.AAC.1